MYHTSIHHTMYHTIGTNGLLTFPAHTSQLDHLPTAAVSPQIREEVDMESSTDTDDDLLWLEDILEQEALEQQLEELFNLTDLDDREPNEPLSTHPPIPHRRRCGEMQPAPFLFKGMVQRLY